MSNKRKKGYGGDSRRKASGGNKKSTKKRKGNGGSKRSTRKLSGGNRRCKEGAKEREGEERREKENEGERRRTKERRERRRTKENEGEKEEMKNEEGDMTVAALREANLRIDKLSVRVQALEEGDGKITTSRSSSSETEGEIWNGKFHNGSWWFKAGPRVNSRQRRSIGRMVQRVKMSGWQDRRERFMFQGDTVEGDGMRVREINMCFPWVPYCIGRKGGTGRRVMDEFRARQEAAMMRSNTRHVSQDGLDTRDARGLFM